MADAVGFITMGGVFAANMTGNTVLAGIAAARGDHIGAWHHFTPLLAFFIGAMMARWLLRLLKAPTVGILIEAALIAGVGFVDIGTEPTVLVVAFAMGLQASSITTFGGSAVSTVVVTSTLARTADTAVDRLWPGAGKPTAASTSAQLLALTWVGYVVGAIAGALLVGAMTHPLIVPALLLLPVLLLRDAGQTTSG
jgi:uncharacterized membrane protein YoaK (UPF0700 family)